jgi:hypothetical protein
MSMLKGDPTQSVDELLAAIRGEAVRGANSGNLNYLMPAFTALLVRLSEAADVRAKVLEKWTKVIVWLTVVLTLATLILVLDVIEKHIWPRL